MTDHDAFCEAECVSEAGGYTSCSCDYRRTRGLVAEHDRQVAERARVEFANELTRKGVYTFDIHSIRRAAKGEQK